jgi:outer membrane immunogenic protein
MLARHLWNLCGVLVTVDANRECASTSQSDHKVRAVFNCVHVKSDGHRRSSVKRFVGFLSGVAALALISAASAADLPRRGPVYKAPEAAFAPAFSWTGFYVGGHIGAGWNRSVWTAPGFYDADIDSTGFIGGGQVGWNYQFANRIVIGIEGDFTGTTMDETVSGCFADPTQTCTTQVDWTAMLTGRLGYAFDRSLVYFKGGAAWAKFNYSNPTPTIPDTFTASETRSGWTIGGGWEYAFAPNWSAKLEYNYLDFGNDQITFVGATGPFLENVDNEIHQVKLGVNYRFGGGSWR